MCKSVIILVTMPHAVRSVIYYNGISCTDVL